MRGRIYHSPSCQQGNHQGRFIFSTLFEPSGFSYATKQSESEPKWKVEEKHSTISISNTWMELWALLWPWHTSEWEIWEDHRGADGDPGELLRWLHWLQYSEERVGFFFHNIPLKLRFFFFFIYFAAEEGLALIDRRAEFCLCWHRAAVYICRESRRLLVSLTCSSSDAHWINAAFFYCIFQ